MRKVLFSILAIGLVAAAVLLPERLSTLSDSQILDNAKIFSQKEQEGFAESVQLTVAEKLLMLRSGAMDLLEMDEDPVEITGQKIAVTGGKVESSADGLLSQLESGVYEENEQFFGKSGPSFWWQELDGETVLVDGSNGEIISEEAVRDAVGKWEGRVTAVYHELRGLQNLGALPILWGSNDTVECSRMKEYVVIDPATQVNFGLYRMELSCSPYRLSIWAESQTGRVAAFDLCWDSGVSLTWTPGGASFGGAWRSYWGMDSVDGSWYVRTHEMLEVTANAGRINGEYSNAGSVSFSYDETKYSSSLECCVKIRGESFLSWNNGLL